MRGEVVYLYAFDVANEIATARVGEILATTPTMFELRPSRAFPKDVPIYKPLAIEPHPLRTSLGQTVRLLVRIYEVGVVSVAMRVAVEVDTLDALLPFHHPRLDSGKSFDDAARALCAEVCWSLRDVMTQPV